MNLPSATSPRTYVGAEDVYRELVEDSNQSWLLGLVAFAVVEEQRIEWMRHHERTAGALPSADQIKHWYSQQPPSVLLRAKGTAENALQVYSEEVSALLEAAIRKSTEDGLIIGEIRATNRFWPQFGANIAAGIVSSVIFAAVLVLVAVVVFNDPSPVAMVKNLKSPTEGVKDGK